MKAAHNHSAGMVETRPSLRRAPAVGALDDGTACVLVHRMLNTVAVVVGAAWTLQEKGTQLAPNTQSQFVEMIVEYGERLSDQLHDLMTGLLASHESE